MAYPDFVDGKPPVISLKQYDSAAWAATTCLDNRRNTYMVVEMEHPEKEVAEISAADHPTLDVIFRSAHAKHAEQK